MKIRIKFKKSGSMKFIGHLDVMRYFQKALRRAEIDVLYSQGFNPHQLMSFASPLGVGLTSDGEYLDVMVGETTNSKDMMDRLNSTMVEGFEIIKVNQVINENKNAMSVVAAADYRISLKDGFVFETAEDSTVSECKYDLSTLVEPDKFQSTFEDFMAQEEIVIMKKSKKSEREVNIRPWIYEVSYKENASNVNTVADEYDNGCKVFLKLATGSANNLKPELVMEAFSNFVGAKFNEFAYQVHRIEVYEELDGGDTETINVEKLVPLDYETSEF